MKRIWIYLMVMFALLSFDFPQERTITGKVTSLDDGVELPGVNVLLKGTTKGTVTDQYGKYSLQVPATGGTLIFSFIGFTSKEIRIGNQAVINVKMAQDVKALEEVVVSGHAEQRRDSGIKRESLGKVYMMAPQRAEEINTEEYEGLEENIFHGAAKKPLSTFSIDVDAASYSNLRRFINNGQHPPKDAVRIEEMINYFDYDYHSPKNEDPFNRLIGYENRKLNDEDFNNDRKDAGELGSGHTVTALYEIIPVGVKSDFYSIDELKYQPDMTYSAAKNSSEWLTIKLRYKEPDENKSKLIVHTLTGNSTKLDRTSDDFRWAASVAAFGMLLRESTYIVNWNYEQVVRLAEGARGADREGYRSEFINLVKSYGLVSNH